MAAQRGSIAASSSSSGRRFQYDVFLSYRSVDTGRGFSDHLFWALQQRGIRTFVDDPTETDQGELTLESLLSAIEESRIAIVILSSNYGSSRWCLDVLIKILECRLVMGMKVFPVFYDVDPSDVRKQRGDFGHGFAMLEDRFKYDEEKVETWRAALREVASLSGFDLMNQ